MGRQSISGEKTKLGKGQGDCGEHLKAKPTIRNISLASATSSRRLLFIPQENPSGNRNRSDCKPIHASPSVAIQMDAENWIV